MCDSFDRWAICEAYYHFSVDYGGDPYANRIGWRLRKLVFSPGQNASLETADESVKAIYGSLVRRHNPLLVGYYRLAKRGHAPAWPGTNHIPRGNVAAYLRSIGLYEACRAACP